MATNTLSRPAGYRASRGKEAIAQAIFTDWADYYGLNYTEITGYENNRTKGDWLVNGRNVEVKSQNIGKYAANFFELGEITDHTKEYHKDGWAKLTNIMAQFGTDITALGNYEYFNFGFTPVADAGAVLIYINRETELIYIYTAKALLTMVANAVKRNGIQVGLGRANMSTVSCFIPNSKVSFQKVNGQWTYTGSVEEQVVWEKLK